MSDRAASPSGARLAALLVLLTAIYVVAGKLGLGLASVHESASAVWPPTGIALAAGLLFGVRVWPAIFVGAFIVNVTTAGSIATSFGIAAGNALEGALGAWLVHTYADGPDAFRKPASVYRFAILAAGASTMVSATIGVATLALGGLAERADLAAIWITWWLGDAVGALVVAPLLVLWIRPIDSPRLARGPLETAGLLVTLGATGWLVFSHDLPITFLTLPPLLWAAFRFGRRGAVSAATVLSVMAVAQTIARTGPFATGDLTESLLFVQAFVGMATLTAIVLAADTRERQRVEAELRAASALLEGRVAERTGSLLDAVEQLERSRAVLTEAQAVAHIGSWQWDVGADRVEWSDELYRIYGLEPGSVAVTFDEYVGRVHPDDRGPTGAAIRAALESGDAFEFEERIVRPDGEVRTLHSKGYVETGPDGRPRRMIGTCHDISARKEVERELDRRMAELTRSNAELSAFTYAASHDLKEPLRTVASNVQLIARRLGDATDPAVRQSLGFAVEGVRRMEELITSLLEYSRADRPSTEVVDAGAALAEALDRLRAPIDEAGARIESVALPRVAVDPGRLVQLFQNLLSNAIKYRDPGRTPVIRIEATRQGPWWAFRVEDNGRGFAAEEADRIFDLFERLHRDHEIPGSGIGLAICRRIVEAQGGRIWAESEPDRGTVFRFTLPAEAGPAA